MNAMCSKLMKVLTSKNTIYKVPTKMLSLAKANKVEISLIERIPTDDERSAYASLLLKYRRMLQHLLKVYEKLEKCNVLLIKFQREFKYIPSDIDFLISEKSVICAMDTLKEIGFKVSVAEKFSITMQRGNIIIDLYVYPSMGNVIYLEQDTLLENVSTIKIYGKEVLVPDKASELRLLILHALFKEMKITLNDFLTTVKWIKINNIDQQTKILAEMLIRIFLKKRSCPAKLNMLEWLLVAEKLFLSEPLFRSTLPNAVPTVLNLKYLREISKKMFWESY